MGINVNEGQIEEIKSKNDIVNTISNYISLKKSGQNYVGKCPFHNEKSPSFTVSDDKQFYHCFGCGASGDVINFIMKMENLDFTQALTLLGDRVGIRVEEFFASKQEKESVNRKNKIYELNREAALYFYNNLTNSQNKGIQYLYNRGLSNSTIKRFGLGYALPEWEGLNNYLKSKGYDKGLIFEAGLVSKRKETEGHFDKFRNRVIFPIINVMGKVIGFGGRSIDESMPKYLNSPETPIFSKGNNLFGINLAKKEIGPNKQIIVVEGYMDVISLYQHGIKNVVATLGTALTKQQGELLKKFAEEVIIAYDSDLAGQAATLRGLDILGEAGCRIKVIHLSDVKDPDELVAKKGKMGFENEIEKAMPLIDYKIFLARHENDLATTEGQIKFVRSITEVLKSIKSPVVVDAYINRIAAESHISIDAIKSEIYGNNTKNNFTEKTGSMAEKYRSKNLRHNNKYNIQPISDIKKQGHIEAERCLLKLIVLNNDLLKEIDDISVNFFSDINHQNIFSIIYSLYEGKIIFDQNILLNKLEIDLLPSYKKIMDSLIPEENQKRAMLDYIRTIKKYKLESQKKELELELKSLENQTNKSSEQIVRIRELCIHYEKLLKELKNL